MPRHILSKEDTERLDWGMYLFEIVGAEADFQDDADRMGEPVVFENSRGDVVGVVEPRTS